MEISTHFACLLNDFAMSVSINLEVAFPPLTIKTVECFVTLRQGDDSYFFFNNLCNPICSLRSNNGKIFLIVVIEDRVKLAMTQR